MYFPLSGIQVWIFKKKLKFYWNTLPALELPGDLFSELIPRDCKRLDNGIFQTLAQVHAADM